MFNFVVFESWGVIGLIISLGLLSLMFGSLLGPITLGVGVSTTINLTYLPQYLSFVTPTVPQSIRVSVLGDGVVMDLDAAGITQLNGLETLGLTANEYIFQLADGILTNKNVEITIVNGDAAAFNIYGQSNRKALNYFVYQRQQILANSGVDFEKFAALAIAAPGAADIFNITYRSGIADSALTLNEIRDIVSYFQNNVGVFVINNFDQVIEKVNIIPSAVRTAYLLKFESIGDIENAPISSTRAR